MKTGRKLIYKLSFTEWAILGGLVISFGSSHARIGSNTDSIIENRHMINENKSFGIAREKRISEVSINTKEYARDYAYRKTIEIKKDVLKHDTDIHLIREENVETRVKLSHIEKNQEKQEKNQEKILELLEKIINNK